MAKFQCTECNHKFDEMRYGIYINEPKYRLLNGNPITCPVCKSRNIINISPSKGLCTNIGKFSSMSESDRKNHLIKRSRHHSKTKLKERREYLKRNFNGRTQDVDFQTNA